MKILITGHRGFIGRHLFDLYSLIYQYEVYGLERGESLSTVPDITYDAVIHCGAVARTAECNQIFDVHQDNVGRTLELLEKVKFKRFINISSCAVYGSHDTIITEESSLRLPSVYAAQKLYSEQLVKFFGLTRNKTVFNLRLFNVYGIGQSMKGNYPNVVASMMRDALTDSVVYVYGDGSYTRDFVHVSDVGTAVTDVLHLPPTKTNITLNVSTGVATSILDVATHIARRCIARIEFRPTRPFDMAHQVASYDALHQLTGWRPLQSFPDGLRRTLDAYV